MTLETGEAILNYFTKESMYFSQIEFSPYKQMVPKEWHNISSVWCQNLPVLCFSWKIPKICLSYNFKPLKNLRVSPFYLYLNFLFWKLDQMRKSSS